MSLTKFSPESVLAQTDMTQHRTRQAPSTPSTIQSHVRLFFWGGGEKSALPCQLGGAGCGCPGLYWGGIVGNAGCGVAVGSAAGWLVLRSAPHSEQKRDPGSFCVPQLGHVITDSSSDSD